jgi:hypothetical protein
MLFCENLYSLAKSFFEVLIYHTNYKHKTISITHVTHRSMSGCPAFPACGGVRKTVCFSRLGKYERLIKCRPCGTLTVSAIACP